MTFRIAAKCSEARLAACQPAVSNTVSAAFRLAAARSKTSVSIFWPAASNSEISNATKLDGLAHLMMPRLLVSSSRSHDRGHRALMKLSCSLGNRPGCDRRCD